MSAKQEAVARMLFKMILYISVVTLALWEFQHKIATQPVRFAAAEAALHAGKPEKARADFDAALQSRSDDPLVYTDIMDSCQREGRWDLMIEYGKRAVEACKQQPAEAQAALYSQLANAYTRVEPAHSQAQALAMARRALDLQPHNSQIQNAYGYLLTDNAGAKGPDVTEALQLLKEALAELHSRNGFARTDPNYMFQLAETEDSYGWALYKDEQYPDAITTLTQALNDYPEGSAAVLDEARKTSFYHLAMAYMHNGQTDQARNAFQKALFYDPNDPDAKEGRKELDSAAAPPTKQPPLPGANPLSDSGVNSSAAPASQNAIKSYHPPDKKK